MYQAKLTGLKPKDVLALIESMPSHVDVKFAQMPQEVTVESATAALRIEPHDHIMLGAPCASRKGSLPNVMINKIERYEKKHGAGSMTRALLTESLSEFTDTPGAVITAGLAKGIIKGVKA